MKEQFFNMQNDSFFMKLTLFTTMVSFSENCGWGNEAYWQEDIENTTARCSHCTTNTIENYKGNCYCGKGGYSPGITNQFLEKTTFVHKNLSKIQNSLKNFRLRSQ